MVATSSHPPPFTLSIGHARPDRAAAAKYHVDPQSDRHVMWPALQALEGVRRRRREAMDSSTWDGVVLRTGTVGDAASAALLHSEQINEGFLAFLGPRFLRRLYRRIVLVPGSFLLVVESQGKTLGFLAGSTDVPALYRAFVWRDGVPAAFACAGRLIRSWSRALETLRHGSGAATTGAELLAVAVDPTARGRGAGTRLVEGFLAEIGQRGRDAAHVVVAADNESAVALYQRAGFHTAERFELHRGTESLLMKWAAPSVSGSY